MSLSCPGRAGNPFEEQSLHMHRNGQICNQQGPRGSWPDPGLGQWRGASLTEGRSQPWQRTSECAAERQRACKEMEEKKRGSWEPKQAWTRKRERDDREAAQSQDREVPRAAWMEGSSHLCRLSWICLLFSYNRVGNFLLLTSLTICVQESFLC